MMTATKIILRPQLATRIADADSRTEAFTRARFGSRRTSEAIELLAPSTPSVDQAVLLDALVDLCLRMDPLVSEVRLCGTLGSGNHRLEDVAASAALRCPLVRTNEPDARLSTVRLAVGSASAEDPYIDASDWCIGFSAPVPAPTTMSAIPAGALLGALEAAKYLFLRSVEVAYDEQGPPEWPVGQVFDLARWTWSTPEAFTPARVQPQRGALPPLALVGCGGVGAGYIWLLRQSRLAGTLLLIDHETIEWHNMNRLFYATIADADTEQKKVLSAAAYMGERWKVEVLPRKAEHNDAVAALTGVARAGGMIASAVGEPETRKFLAWRGFERFFDAATHSLGSAQVLALVPGRTTCVDCHLRTRALRADGACGVATTPVFSGVVPHLSAYAGVLLAFEQLRWWLDPEGALAGANTQSVFRVVDELARESTTRCDACPHARTQT